jgi:3-hydroxyisobutyrate dehydrogenase/glyoxylate/succinic semialdehyde reductase
MNVGFIGLGTMGSRMAANLQKQAQSLVVFNRTRGKAEPLLADGAKWADSPASLGEQVEIIFTMLARPDTVEEAALGKDGFLSRLAKGRLWVDCSTVDPTFSKKMAAAAQARGIRFLDAPVSGSKIPAAQAKLIFWVGGDAPDLEEIRPMLQCMGSKIVHCGGPGTGASMKMVMNQLLGTQLAAFAEGLVLGQSLGLSRQILFEALFNGPAAAPFVAAKRERIEAGNYAQADFALRLLQKDLHLAAVSAYETGTAMPLTNAAKEIYRLAIRDGHGDEDISAIYGYLAQNRDAEPKPAATPRVMESIK